MKTFGGLRLALVLGALLCLGGHSACEWGCLPGNYLLVATDETEVDAGTSITLFWDNEDVYDCTVWAQPRSGGLYVLPVLGNSVTFDEPEEDIGYLVSCDSACGEVFGTVSVYVNEPAP